mgnify:CR=1 FL=1
MGCSNCKQKNSTDVGFDMSEEEERRFNLISRVFTCICVLLLSPIILIFINYVAISNILMGNTFSIERLPILSAILNKKKNNDFNEVENKYAVEEKEEVI